MVCTWPSSTTERALRQLLGAVVDDLLDVGGHRAEIAALRRRIDLTIGWMLYCDDHRVGGGRA